MPAITLLVKQVRLYVTSLQQVDEQRVSWVSQGRSRCLMCTQPMLSDSILSAM